MSWFARFRRPRLVPIAEFPERNRAEEAWRRLDDEGIPATVEHDPGALGGRVVTRLLVEAPNVLKAQRLIASLVADPDD